MQFDKIADLKGAFAGGTAAVLVPGPTLADYDDSRVPAEWIRIASQEAALKSWKTTLVVAAQPDRMEALRGQMPQDATVIVGGRAIHAHMRDAFANPVLVADTGRRERPGDAFGFYGPEVMAIDLARVLGCARVFVFGLDLYRRKEFSGFCPMPGYSHDDQPPFEQDRAHNRDGRQLDAWVTRHHRTMFDGLHQARKTMLWAGMRLWCVGSPQTQQDVLEKLTWEEFDAQVAADRGGPLAAPPTAVAEAPAGNHAPQAAPARPPPPPPPNRLQPAVRGKGPKRPGLPKDSDAVPVSRDAMNLQLRPIAIPRAVETVTSRDQIGKVQGFDLPPLTADLPVLKQVLTGGPGQRPMTDEQLEALNDRERKAKGLPKPPDEAMFPARERLDWEEDPQA